MSSDFLHIAAAVLAPCLNKSVNESNTRSIIAWFCVSFVVKLVKRNDRRKKKLHIDKDQNRQTYLLLSKSTRNGNRNTTFVSGTKTDPQHKCHICNFNRIKFFVVGSIFAWRDWRSIPSCEICQFRTHSMEYSCTNDCLNEVFIVFCGRLGLGLLHWLLASWCTGGLWFKNCTVSVFFGSQASALVVTSGPSGARQPLGPWMLWYMYM